MPQGPGAISVSVGARWGTCPRKVTRVGDGTMCQPQPWLCSLGILCWKHILRGHPINGLLKRRSGGQGEQGSHKQWGCAASHQQRI